eukprot:jgi/Undpi1/1783/HiC_scaffold_12.g05170.m1
MRRFVGFSLVVVASLLERTRGFVVLPGVATTSRHSGGAFGHSDDKRPRGTRSSAATACTRLEAKATYKNFEDMLEKEPGALLVDFYATWCGPCKMMAETLAEVGPKMQDELKIFKIDSDKYPALMTKFGVSGLPTLILFKDGKELQRIEGFLPAAPLMEQVKYWLAGAAEAQDGGQPSQGDACAPPPQDACAPPAQDACAPPAQDACSPPPRDACVPPPQA